MKKPAKKAAAKKPVAKRPVSRASSTAKKAAAKSAPRSSAKSATKSGAKSMGKNIPKAASKKPVAKVPAKQAASRGVASKSIAKKAIGKAPKKIVGKPAVSKPAPIRKPTSKVAVAKKPAPEKAIAKKHLPGTSLASKAAAAKRPQPNKAPQRQPPPQNNLGSAPAKSGRVSRSNTVPSDVQKTAMTVDRVAMGSQPSEPSPRDATQASTPTFAPQAKVEKRILGRVARAIIRPLHDKDKKPAVPKSPSPAPSPAPDLLENDEGAHPGFFQTDEVFDETDYAQHLQLMEQADISRRARELNRPQVHPDFDGQHCLECDIQIPPARLQAGRIRCVDCQEEVENEERRNLNLTRGR